MKKAIKIVLWTLIALVSLLLVLSVTLPLWIDGVATKCANCIVPNLTQTSFHLGEFKLNPYTGKASIADLKLGNPKGFKEEFAVKVGRADVAMETKSLSTDVIVINEMNIKDVFVYLGSLEEKTNFEIIGENFSSQDDSCDVAEADESKNDAEDEIRVVIKKLVIDGTVFKYEMLPIPLPKIELEGIGEKSGGATLIEVGEILLNAIMELALSAGDGIMNLGKGATNLITDTANVATGLIGNVLNAAVDSEAESEENSKLKKKINKEAERLNEKINKEADRVNKQINKALEKLFK
jgi:hypothetical protein